MIKKKKKSLLLLTAVKLGHLHVTETAGTHRSMPGPMLSPENNFQICPEHKRGAVVTQCVRQRRMARPSIPILLNNKHYHLYLFLFLINHHSDLGFLYSLCITPVEFIVLLFSSPHWQRQLPQHQSKHSAFWMRVWETVKDMFSRTSIKV